MWLRDHILQSKSRQPLPKPFRKWNPWKWHVLIPHLKKKEQHKHGEICTYCGRQGHFRAECKVKPKGLQRDQVSKNTTPITENRRIILPMKLSCCSHSDYLPAVISGAAGNFMG